MSAFGDFFRSLKPGNDHQLAASQYAGRESASDRAARLRREGHRRSIDKTARKERKREQRNPGPLFGYRN